MITRLAMTLLVLTPLNLSAREEEPHLSVRTGLRCSQCHVNRTGGGGRTDFGSVYGQTRLSIGQFGFQGRSLNNFLSVGANLRLRAEGTPAKSTPRTEMGLREANIQVEARVIPDVLAFYVDETVGPGAASTREAFGLVEGLPLDGYLKVGKFLLPYGLRLVDDAEFIRQSTGFSYATPDQGVEVGFEPSQLSLFVALTNGSQGASENNSGKQITATGAWILPRFRIGASVSRNEGSSGRRDVYGGFGGFNLGRFTVLGELDLIKDAPDVGPDLDQMAAYIEGNFLAVRGVNAKITYGFLDPNRDIGQNARTRARFGIETFPIQFLQVSAFYTLIEDIPQASDDMDRLSLEFHLYF